jgi:hypothetical protein
MKEKQLHCKNYSCRPISLQVKTVASPKHHNGPLCASPECRKKLLLSENQRNTRNEQLRFALYRNMTVQTEINIEAQKHQQKVSLSFSVAWLVVLVSKKVMHRSDVKFINLWVNSAIRWKFYHSIETILFFR